jgi:hypothetical protein
MQIEVVGHVPLDHHAFGPRQPDTGAGLKQERVHGRSTDGRLSHQPTEEVSGWHLGW